MATLSRKHFIELATMIGETSTYDQLTYQIKSFCKRHNRAFQESKFDDKINKVRKEVSDNNNPYLHGFNRD